MESDRIMEKFESDKKRYDVLRKVFGKVICRTLGYSCPVCDPACGPMLVVSNHNTDFDPIFVGMSFKDHMYFVASEHIFRWGLISRLLDHVFSPIARLKGTTDAQAAMQIMRRLRAGQNVCLFAEGNRSFNGVTGPIFPATGKLARAAKASLVTFRMQGGYLLTPRWATERRHGTVTGRLVHVYSNEELKKMTDAQIEAAIENDLREDAFERQKAEMCPYPGKRLAEGLENALYICPKCGAIGKLKGSKNDFNCACGFSVRLNEYGFFAGEDLPFENVRDWDAWQNEQMTGLVENAIQSPDDQLFSDEDQRLMRLSEDHGMTEVAFGKLAASANGISVGDTFIPFEEISDMALVGRNNIVFNAGTVSYEIRAKKRFRCCGRKYLTLYHTVKEQRTSAQRDTAVS